MPNEPEISFVCTPKESVTIWKILHRATKSRLVKKRDRMDRYMDLVATHANGCPMDFERLLAADDFNFAHDFSGIANCLDRTTGQLTNNFLPRFAKKEG